MKVLISPISVEEALSVCEGGADIIDIKNVQEGSLGASFPWIIRDVVNALGGKPVTFSCTLGDLPFKPGTAALAAAGAASNGARYIKAGLHGTRSYVEALAVMKAVQRTCREFDPNIIVVAAGYADYRRFDGLSTEVLVNVARDAGCDLVMVDTAFKDGKTLFDALSLQEIEDFVGQGHEAGLQVALAGSVRFEHLAELHRVKADVVGVRGCVCRANNRLSRIDAELVSQFVKACRLPAAA
ncbi:(5-formylfuran-3-yl)methyl phosphate synthase [Myxococcus stipitatus]|uniref:(5-formylfuran-3-yl)methyl phosphate synthase n=1 Tax=Myxococcus stipitatus TaxID=83455 RepID=UPI001F219CA7|nr:(5-formylfuran-3-yl)methyl phosphate synthase [Myxococcus stipitatus]MCE9671357.1 (5-formylfuran-3-yl)methyl phosphate synthase [Myxococcus stipitatus]